VRGGSVGQRARSQLLKIEQKFDTFFVSARIVLKQDFQANENLYGWFISKSSPFNVNILCLNKKKTTRET
jgi:hypothetical protein